MNITRLLGPSSRTFFLRSYSMERVVSVYPSAHNRCWQLFDETRQPHVEKIETTNWQTEKIRLKVNGKPEKEVLMYPTQNGTGFVTEKDLND